MRSDLHDLTRSLGEVMTARVLAMVMCSFALATAGTVTKPSGWTSDSKTSLSLSQQLGAVPHFGGLASIVTVEAFRTTGGVLYTTRVIANVKPEQRDAAASAELDDLRASLRRGSNVEPTTWKREAIAGRLEATLAWNDANTVTESRMLVVADEQHVIAVSGECVLAPDAPAEVGAACRAALATLDPELPAEKRVALTLAPEAAPPPPPASSTTRAPSMSEAGERPVLQPVQVAPASSSTPDRRPMYVGGGLVVLALVFWWNRRRREKIEREYEDRAAPTRRRDADDDDDDDDLHAAANEVGSKNDDTQGKS